MGRPTGKSVSAQVSLHGSAPVRVRPFKSVFKTDKNERVRSMLRSASGPFYPRARAPFCPRARAPFYISNISSPSLLTEELTFSLHFKVLIGSLIQTITSRTLPAFCSKIIETNHLFYLLFQAKPVIVHSL